MLQKEPDCLQDVLNLAGNNRVELEKVLKRYEDNSLKLKAASFLISNMKDLYTLDGSPMDQYYNSMDSLQERSAQMNVFELRALSDSVIKPLHFNGLDKKFDLNQMNAGI